MLIPCNFLYKSVSAGESVHSLQHARALILNCLAGQKDGRQMATSKADRGRRVEGYRQDSTDSMGYERRNGEGQRR